MRADIVPGGTFPDYELTDHAKMRRRLSELQGNDPLILVLARGHFCPKDHLQHLELAASYPKIAVAYTQIVTISTDNIVETREFRASVGAQWTFLSMPAARCRRTSTSRSTPTLTTIRWSRTRSCSSPGS
jgi:peroxiredoxin